MRLLHINTQRQLRGGERQTLWLAEAQRDAGWEPQLVCRPGSALARAARTGGLRVTELTMHSDLDLMAAAALRALIRRDSLEVVHSHDSHAHALSYLATRRLKDPPLRIGTRRLLVGPKRVRGLHGLKYRRSLDAFIAISQAVADGLRGAGVPEEIIHVVPSGIPIAPTATRDPARARARLGLDADGPPLVGAVGALEARKAHADLIAAAARLRAGGRGLRLVIVGEGPLRASLLARVEQEGLSDRVWLAGTVDDVPAWLAALDLYVQPSREEALSLALLEAMAALVPVVATRVGGIPEALAAEAEGQTGWLADPADPTSLAAALEAALADPAEAQRRALRARRRVVAHFGLEAMVAGTAEVYARARERRRGAHV